MRDDICKYPTAKRFVDRKALYEKAKKLAWLKEKIALGESILAKKTDYMSRTRIKLIKDRMLELRQRLSNIETEILRLCKPIIDGYISKYGLWNGFKIMPLDRDDLEVEASLDLLLSIDKYDFAHKTSSFNGLYKWIEKAMSLFFRNKLYREKNFAKSRGVTKPFTEYALYGEGSEQHIIESKMKMEDHYQFETQKQMRRRQVFFLLKQALDSPRLRPIHKQIIRDVLKYQDLTLLADYKIVEDKYGLSREGRRLLIKKLEKMFAKK